jgi:nitrogen regulatory protein PII
MSYLILFVLDDPTKSDEILNAWDDAGVHGITILLSSGMGKLRSYNAIREDAPLLPAVIDLLEHEEVQNRTFFTIVEDDITVHRVVEATQSITGDLDQPHTGILAVIPVGEVYGLHRKDG